MKTVFVVYEGWHYEGDNIRGVFSTLQLAKEKIEKLIKEKSYLDYYHIEEVGLDNSSYEASPETFWAFKNEY